MYKPHIEQTLLIPTLVYAVNHIPFYKKWAAVDVLSAYDTLPLIDKQIFVRHPEDFCNPELDSAYVQYSSGATSGIRTPVYKSSKEVEFIRNFLSKKSTKDDWNIYLKYQPAGDVMPLANDMHCLNVLDSSSFSDEYLASLEKISLKKRVHLIGLESQLRIFAYSLLKSNRKIRIAELVVGGDLITDSLLMFYRSVFDCQIINRFGITEIFGGATQCPMCNFFHFDDHTIFDIHNIQISNGILIGELSLSSCFPFSQKTMLIKYLTGDVVAVNTKNHCSRQGIKLLGRTKQIPKHNNKYVISSCELYNFLDSFGLVGRSKLFRKNVFDIDPSALGHLRFSYELIADVFMLNVCLKTFRQSNAEELNALTSIIKKGVYDLLMISGVSVQVIFHDEDSSIAPFLPDEVED